MFVTCLFTLSAGEDANSRMKTHFINKITFYNHGTISSKYDQSMPPAVNVNNLVLVIYCWHIWQEILILVVNEMQRYYKPHSFILTGHIIDHMKNIMNRYALYHMIPKHLIWYDISKPDNHVKRGSVCGCNVDSMLVWMSGWGKSC